jgi:pimeloyl-ACP methyl ester carboxylesterase
MICIVVAIVFLSPYALEAHSHLTITKLPKQNEDSFQEWLPFAKQQLKANSKIKKTSRGPIEYVKKGKGPVVLALHGAYGGYDQGLLLASHLLQDGFSIVAPSRPGYLRTPLSAGKTAKQQASAMIALLDALHIEKVAVLGFSFGSPVAFELATRYPERVWAAAFESIGGKQAEDPLYSTFNAFFSVEDIPEVGPWELFYTARYYPKTMLKEILLQDNILPTQAFEERLQYVMNHPEQLRFLQEIVYTAIPKDRRQKGTDNDLRKDNPWRNVKKLSKPTMIIQAAAGSRRSYTQAASIAKTVPKAQFVPVEGSGDLIWFGPQAEVWQKQLSQFLKKHRPKK